MAERNHNAEIWLRKDSEAILIPILPSEFTFSTSMNNTVQNVHSLGDVYLAGQRGLKSFSFSSFFPRNEYSFAVVAPPYSVMWRDKYGLNPYAYVDMIERWMDEVGQTGKSAVVQLNLLNDDKQLYLNMLIDSFEYGENDGTGDVNYTISLSEFREIRTTVPPPQTQQSKDNATVQPVEPARPAKQVTSQNYVIKSRDTLWSIAKRLTGNSANWRAIYNQNKDKIETTAQAHGKTSSADGHWIYPGTELIITV